jgi:hypothetical protein
MLSNLLASPDMDRTSEEWGFCFEIIKDKIKDLIECNSQIKENFVKWIAKITNECINKINIDFMNPKSYNKSLMNDVGLVNVLSILLFLWEDNNVALKDIDFDYIISDKCPIKWFDKTLENDKKTYNFGTECFFLILNTLRVGFIPALNRSKQWPELYEHLSEELGRLVEYTHDSTVPRAMRPLITQGMVAVNQQQNFVKDLLHDSCHAVTNDSLTIKLNTFYSNVMSWINIHKHGKVDDILSDMLYYIDNTEDYDFKFESAGDDDLYNFILDVMNTDTYSANIHIKTEAMKIFGKMILPILCDSYSTDGSERDMLMKYIHAMIDLHNNLSVHHHDRIARIFTYVTIKRTFTKKDKFIDIFNKEMAKDINATKRFFNLIFIQLSDLLENIEKTYSNIDNDDEEDESKTGIYIAFKFVIKMTIFIDQLLNILLRNPDLKEHLMSKEIFNTLAVILNQSLNFLGDRVEYKEDLQLGTHDVNLKKYLRSLANIFSILCYSNCDLKSFIDDSAFRIENYELFNEMLRDEVRWMVDQLLYVH